MEYDYSPTYTDSGGGSGFSFGMEEGMGLGALFGGLGSAYSSYRETKRGHDFNRQEATKARDFSAQQAAINRDFQERMANTQFSRAADDMDRAGLNRILALGQPAAASSGSQASSHQASSPGVKSVGESGVRSASAMAQIGQIEAQRKLLNSQANLTDQTARKVSAEADKAEITRGPYKFFNELLSGEDTSARSFADRFKRWLSGVQEGGLLGNKSGEGPTTIVIGRDKTWWDDKRKQMDQWKRQKKAMEIGQGTGGGR